MKKKIIFVIPVVIFLAGALIMFYPDIDNWFYDRQVNRMEKQYFEENTKNKLLDALYKRLQKYNVKLYENKQDKLVDPFSYSQPSFSLKKYGIKDNCIGFISLPAIKMKLPIYLGANTENMSKGAVHLTETSFPIGGDNTNAVIAAHRGTSKVMFLYINRLKLGDSIIIKNFKETLHYQVCQIKIIAPTEIDKLLIQDGRDLVTLISCNPPGYHYQRYVVYCERAQPAQPAN